MGNQGGRSTMMRKGFWCALALLVLPVSLAVAIAPLCASEAHAAADPGETRYQSLIQNVEDGKLAPAEYSKDSYGDPYGYGKDVPFYMAGQDELLLYHGFSGNTQIISCDGVGGEGWDKATFLNTGDLDETIYKPNADESVDPLNWVQMTAFDPTGSGRNDYVAMIGVHYTSETDKGLYLIVYDSDGHDSGYQKVGTVNWVGREFFSAMNYLSITAGDYNQDKKDTLVVYGAFDDKGMGLYEFTVTPKTKGDGTVTIEVTRKSSNASAALLNPNADLTVTSGYPMHTLYAQVKTGDVDGDKVDDLVVSSYKCDRVGMGGTEHPVENEMYPYVAVSFGGGKTGDITSKKDAGMLVRSATNAENQYESAHMPGLSTGDINGDKRDEIVLGGIYYKYSSSTEKFEGDSGKLGIATLKVSNGKLSLNSFDAVNANKFTAQGHKWEKSCDPRSSVQCVAFDGPGNPEQIYVDGWIYKYQNGQVQLASDGAGGFGGASSGSNDFFWDVAAGNFTGSDSSREQIVGVVCVRQKNYEQYHFEAFMIQGETKSDGTLTESYTYSSWNNHYSTSLQAAPLEMNCGLNFAVCAVDNDNDGVIVRYAEKGYTYSDPEVLAVLQAAPYFAELPYAASGTSTSYAISESRSFEEGSSTSTSAGIAFVAGVETNVCDIEMEAGYSHEWSEEFTRGVSTTSEYSWSAQGKDQVLVYRTPVMLYTYEVMLPDGTWPDTPEERENNVMTVTVPCASIYETMSVADYNAFAGAFNKHMKERADALRSQGQTINDSKIPKLEVLDDPYLQHEGNPEKYRSFADTEPWMILQGSAFPFTVGNTTPAFSFSSSESTSHSASTTHGFSFEMTVSVGFEILGNGSKAGAKTSLEYTAGHSTTETIETGNACGCAVPDMDADELWAAEIDPSFVKKYYGFYYQVAMWDSNLPSNALPVDGKASMVPIVGYAISGINKPNAPKLSGPNNLRVSEGYEAQTLTGYSLSYDPVPMVTKERGDDAITFDAATNTIHVAKGLKAGNYPVTFRVSNGNPFVDTAFSFKLKVIKAEEAIAYSISDEIRDLSTNPDSYIMDTHGDGARLAAKTVKEKCDALSAEEQANLLPADVQKLNAIIAVINEIESIEAAQGGETLASLKRIVSDEQWRSSFEECTSFLDSDYNYNNDQAKYEEAWNQLNQEFIPTIEAAWQEYCGLTYPGVYLFDMQNRFDVGFLSECFARIGSAQIKYAQNTEQPFEQDWEAYDQARAKFRAFKEAANGFSGEAPDAASTYDAFCEEWMSLRNELSQMEGWIRGGVAVDLFDGERSIGEQYFRMSEMVAERMGGASAVEKLLRELPDAEDIQLEDESMLNECQEAYNALSDEQKALIRQDLVEALVAAQEALAELKADPLDIEEAQASIPNQYYTGQPLTPIPVVTYEGKNKPLENGVDFRLMYSNNTDLGVGTVKIIGIGKYTGSKTVFFSINPMSLQNAKVTLSNTAFTYNGKVQKPIIKTINGLVLVEGADYVAQWSNSSSKDAGTYTVTIMGIGNYAKATQAEYSINKAANPLVVSGKTATVKLKDLKKKAQKVATAKAYTFTKAGQGKMTFKLTKVTKAKYKKFFKVNAATGKVSVKKKLKKGTYKLKVAVKAAGNANYEASAEKMVTVKIRVK